MKRLVLAVVILMLTGCMTRPTRVSNNQNRKIEEGAGPHSVVVQPSTIIIDVRPAFDYSTAHIPHSVSFAWTDFTEPEAAQRGIVLNDTFAVARRLARAGISPTTPVVVVGNGKNGGGEEGRIAWMLEYLGATNVQFTDLDTLKARYVSQDNDESPKAVPIWKPVITDDLNVARAEVLFAINKVATHQPAAFHKGDQPILYRIIDVRSAGDYLGRGGIGAKTHIPNMDAINIPWKDFFDRALAPKSELVDRLAQIGIKPDQRIVVLDEDGVASGAVTLALRRLGFSHAGNYSGGLTDLMSAYPVYP